ncbi:TRAP transporter 4TM/12TM fusion protein [Desulfobaculum xiamenense]|uniref:TRAP transporter 4TM/12TM fusion protein n=1 Tax=Desulfobaculum xiamenense TaxID=995050 RepID=A0A846QXT3_9BACT|nr:TRAP transporter fused permease subunit [Desulfobaculum xiamenense]NJB69439.1 TRAP transporter 4TM/12TM fusion protein [Desulfobaculum xiamenense]
MPESDTHAVQTPELSAEKKAALKRVMSKESRSGRKLGGFWRAVADSLGAFMVVFYFFSIAGLPIDTQFNRGVYVLLTYVMILICFPMSRRSPSSRPSAADLALVALALVTVGYYMLEFEAFNYRSGNESMADIWISGLGVLLSLEVCRRVLGWSMTFVGVAFLAYGVFGPYFPDLFAHRGFSVERMAVTLFMEQDGVFGVMANVLVTYVILFIFFGSFMQKSGVGKFFIDWPLALAGRSVGGPAKVAVIASAFFGSVSGSAIANTVSTGTFTIPLMKRAGFRRHVAGAIEPSASIGGMFMPPIMGAGGFLMAELTEVPYVDIMKMAIFPALLYFFSVLSMIHFEARKHDIRGLVDEDFEPASVIFRRHWYKSIPLLIIVVLMLLGYSPGMSAFWATVSCIAISWTDRQYRMGIREIWEATVNGARATLVIGATVGVIGIIVGTISLTGIGLKFSDIIISLSGGNLPLSIVLIGLASLVLGMGVPVTASYLITASLAVPAMVQMLDAAGIAGHTATSMVIASHMIVYWFSQDSNITPPVCVAAYAGAAIAGSDPWRTGWTAFKFAKLLYVVPFLFAFEPAILLYGSFIEVCMAFTSAVIGTLAFSALTMGYLIRRTTLVEWLIFALGTFLCYHPHHVYNVVGVSVVGLVYLMQKYKNRRDSRNMNEAPA